MRLVDDDEVGAGAQEVEPARLGLDEVHGDDDVGVPLEERHAGAATPLEARDGAREDELGLDVELLAQLALPLLGEGGRAEDGEPVRLAPGDQLGGDEAGLDRLADADVVGDEEAHRVELERHEERDELVGARLDGDGAEAPERPGAGAEAEPDGVAQEAAGAEVTEARGVGRRELGGLDVLERREDPRDLFLRAAERAEDEEVVFRFGKDDPFAATGGDEGADGEGHAWLPFPASRTGARKRLGVPDQRTQASSRARVRAT